MLNSAGRWALRVVDYRIYGMLILGICVFFILWRRFRYKSWPTGSDYFNLILSLLGIAAALQVAVVFLMPKPPAVDALSGFMLGAIGLLVPTVCLVFAWPWLRVLFLPSAAPKPPQAQTAKSNAERGDS